MSRTTLRTAATLSGAAALTALSLAPAVGATVVSRSEASAVTVSVAGQGANSGTYSATNDGSRQSTDGTSRPPIGVLSGQKALNAGVLAQEAVARTDGTSAACAAWPATAARSRRSVTRAASPPAPRSRRPWAA